MDILSTVGIELRCNNCGGSYEITLRQVLLLQQVLHEGCQARSETECYPVAYASLLDPEFIEQFRAAWESLEEAARASGGRLQLRAERQASSQNR
jgi:hypothetical protein